MKLMQGVERLAWCWLSSGSDHSSAGIASNCHGSGENMNMFFCRGLASYISTWKGGLEGSIHYPSDRMSTYTLTYSYPFLPRAADWPLWKSPEASYCLLAVSSLLLFFKRSD